MRCTSIPAITNANAGRCRAARRRCATDREPVCRPYGSGNAGRPRRSGFRADGGRAPIDLAPSLAAVGSRLSVRVDHQAKRRWIHPDNPVASPVTVPSNRNESRAHQGDCHPSRDGSRLHSWCNALARGRVGSGHFTGGARTTEVLVCPGAGCVRPRARCVDGQSGCFGPSAKARQRHGLRRRDWLSGGRTAMSEIP